jgi:DNA-binding NtrC family response regulator
MSDHVPLRLLVVDDQASIRRLCTALGASLGFACSEAENAAAALPCLQSASPELVLAGLKLEDAAALEFLAQVKKRLPRTEVALLTGGDAQQSAEQAMRLGAYDYLAKPLRAEELELVLERMAEKVRLAEENHLLQERVTALETAAAPSAAGMEPQSTDLEEMERATIQRVFREVKGDKSLAGRKLGISRATLYRKLKRYGIQSRA